MFRAISKGAAAGGIAGVAFLTGVSVWAYPYNRTPGEILSALVLWSRLVGLGAAAAGGLIGWASHRWQARGISRGRLSVYAALLGAALGNGVAFASLGFMYSFGAMADRLSIPEWVGAFLPIFFALVPLALLIGLLCGFLAAWAAWETKT